MSIFWATQYRPADLPGAIANFREISDVFARVGATQARLLVAMTQDVGSAAVVTDWNSIGDAVAAFDPVDGTAFKVVASSTALSAQLANYGSPLRRVIGNIGSSFGDINAGKYVVNVVQSSAAGPELWAEAGEVAWEALKAQGAIGAQLGRVLTGDATGLYLSSVLTDDVNQFTAVLSKLPPRLVELFAATGTSTVLRNIHRIIRA